MRRGCIRATAAEFIHGMTKERPSRPGELSPAQTAGHDNWAVGFYNARGGFTSIRGDWRPLAALTS